MKLVTQQHAAQFLGVTDRSIRNMISRGQVTGYQVPGLRAVRVDLEEIERLVRAIPTLSRRDHKPFGPKARIVSVPGVPVVERRRPVVVEGDR